MRLTILKPQSEGEKMKKVIVFLSLMSLNVFAFDLNDIQLGFPGYGGSGCPAGSASVTLSPDKKILSVIFDEFMVEAGSNGKRLDRKSCNIAVPVHVPQGYSVSLVDVDFRGYVAVPRGGQARLSSEYFFAGQQGPRFTKTFRGGSDIDYLFTNNLMLTGNIWSRCGVDVNLRINSSMLVRSNGRLDDALATVDSADVRAGIVYQMQWRRCN